MSRIHRRLTVEELEPRIAPSVLWDELVPGSASGGGICNGTATSYYPAVAIGTDGNPIVAWQENTTTGQSEIYIKRWDPASLTWVRMAGGMLTQDNVSNINGLSQSPAIGVAGDGKPVVVWQDNYPGAFKIYAKRWSGTAWVAMGAGSTAGNGISGAGTAGAPSMAMGADGFPIVAWADSSSGQSEIYVRRWDGASWVELGAGSASGGGISNTSAGSSGDPYVALGPDGNPIVAWHDSFTGGYEIYARRWDPSSASWVEIGTGSASGGGISNNTVNSMRPVVAFDANDNPVVAWQDAYTGSNNEIYVRRWDGTAWAQMGTGSATKGGVSNNTGQSYAPSIVADTNGNPILTWYDVSSGNNEIYALRWASDVSSWVEIGPSSAQAGGISNNIGTSAEPAIVFGANGNPVLAWHDSSNGWDYEIFLRQWNGSCWVEMGGRHQQQRGHLPDSGGRSVGRIPRCGMGG
jgi:hypothetical protein